MNQNESLMRDRFTDNYIHSILGRGLDETKIGSRIICEAQENLIQMFENAMSSTQGAVKDITNFLVHFTQNEETEYPHVKGLGGLAFAVVEFVLSGMVINKSLLEGSGSKVRNVRLSTGNRLRKWLNLEDTIANQLIAVQLIEMAVGALSDYIGVEKFNDKDDPTHINMRYYLLDERVEELSSIIESISKSGYYALPMTEPPLDWSVEEIDGKVVVEGGYRFIRTELIRGGKIDMPRYSFNPAFLAKEKRPLEALNILQAVPFRVNKEVLDVVKNDLVDRPEKPKPSEFVKEFNKRRFEFFQTYPTKEEREAAGVEIEEIPEEVLEYNSQVADYKTLIGKLVSAKLAISLADEYREHSEIYFPHNFDYRGRMYPIPTTLTPQGDDIAKGMLEFAHGVTLTEEGLEACFAYLASVYGHDKETYARRIELGIDIFNDPDTDYKDAEEPYVFLQTFLYLKKAAVDPTTPCHLCLATDGSCNGLQHMAAITMDKQGGYYVNVGPSAPRQDIYLEIADHSANLIEEDIRENSEMFDKEDVEQLALLHSFMTGDKRRKIAKRPVMINPYGGTFMGYKEYIFKALQDFYPKHSTSSNSTVLTTYINRAMHQKLKGGRKYQKWIREVFSGIARLGVFPTFRTPDGFMIVNSSVHCVEEQKSMSSIVGRRGKTVLRYHKRTTQINPRKIGTRAQPNVIHALDATHLRYVVKQAHSEGITNLWFIHDSFGTDPNQYARLNAITREEFVKMYDPESWDHPIDVLVESLEEALLERGLEFEFPEFPVFKGENRLDLEGVLNNEHFFQ